MGRKSSSFKFYSFLRSSFSQIGTFFYLAFVFVFFLFLFVPFAFVGGVVFVNPTPDTGSVFGDNVTLNVTSNFSDSSVFLRWNESLIGYWSFEYYNSTGVYDNSSYDTFATFEGILSQDNVSEGVRGNALNFSEGIDYLSIGQRGYDSWTISIWVNPHSNWSELSGDPFYSNLAIVRGDEDSSFLGIRSGAISCYYDNIVSYDFSGNPGWHHVVYQYNGTHLIGYVDYSNKGSILIDNPFNDSSVERVLGSRANNIHHNYYGLLDEFLIWNRVLSSEEVMALYNGTGFSKTFLNLGNLDYQYDACEMNSSGYFSCTQPRVISNGISPNISDVSVEKRRFRATISWVTEDFSNSSIEYWADGSYENLISDSSYNLTHSITLENLDSETSYSYRITSVDKSGTSVSSGNLTFSTNEGNFYVDSIGGNDFFEGNFTHPWKTVSRVNSETFYPGESVLFSKGGLWNETLVINDSGNITHPITFGDYGAGEKPLFNLTKNLGDWSLYSGNVYVTDVSFNVSQLFIDGERFSSAREPDEGYYYIDEVSSSLNNFVVDYNLSVSSENITGSEIWIRLERWELYGFGVTGFENGNISLDGSLGHSASINEGYILMNKLWMLDSNGEWFYNFSSGKLYVYFDESPLSSSEVISVSSSSNGVFLNGVNNVILRNLKIFGPDSSGVVIQDSQNVSLNNFSIFSSGEMGINISSSSGESVKNIFVKDNFINDSGFYGFFSKGTGVESNFTLDNNSILNTMGLLVSKPSLNVASWGRGVGIYSYSNNSLFSNNTIDNSGYSCFLIGGENSVIEQNSVQNCCVVLDDGGGIYFGGKASEQIFRNNIVSNSLGNNEGTPRFSTNNPPFGYGIYTDSGSNSIEIYNNTISNSSQAGYYNHNAYNITLQDNTFYNNYVQVSFGEDVESSTGIIGNVTNNTFLRNTLFSVGGQIPYRFITVENSTEDFGTFENNTFFKGSISYILLDYLSSSDYNYYSFLSWKNIFGRDSQGSDVSDFYEVEEMNFSLSSDSEELISNGNFVSNISGWSKWPSTVNASWLSSCELGNGCLNIYSDNDSVSSFLTYTSSLFNISNGSDYILSFDAVSESDDLLTFYFVNGSSVFGDSYNILIETTEKHFDLSMSSSGDVEARLTFLSGTSDSNLSMDNISLKEADSLNLNNPSDDSIILINSQPAPETFFFRR